MYCIQVNKLLQNLKSDRWKSKPSLYITLTYDKQKRRTTCKQETNNSSIWYESFLFVLDKSEKKKLKIEIFDKHNKKTNALVSEEIGINRSKMVSKNTKYLEIQHGSINYDNEQKIISLEIENKELSATNQQLTKNTDNLLEGNKKLKKLIENIDNLINDEAYD